MKKISFFLMAMLFALTSFAAESLTMVGTVKRAVQNGGAVIVLTHEADGTAHIYNVIAGVVTAELSQEGVVVDPDNAGEYLALADIAITEDGKLVGVNHIMCQSADSNVDEGMKRGESRFYIWNDLAGDPALWFSSKMSSNWFRSKQGYTMALKGDSDNCQILLTGPHGQNGKARFSVYNIIEGQYVEPGVNNNEYYHFHNGADNIGTVDMTSVIGTNYELNASPLADGTWILDGDLINPYEIIVPETNNVALTDGATLTEDLGKKYNGASYVTVDDKVLMVAPYATPDGELTGVEILDITAGLDAAQYVDQLFINEAVAATAAATAVQVVEGGLNITLVADDAIHTLEAELSNETEYQVYEETINNLVIDPDNLVLIGGPSSAFQVDVYLVLGEDNMDGTFTLSPESSIAVLGSDATFVDGYAYEIDINAPAAKAVVRCLWNGMALEFHLTMSAAPMDATEIVVENATVEVDKMLIFGDTYEYALKMTGEWLNAEDGLTYPVLVEVPVYYPNATEPSTILSTVIVGDRSDYDPWLGACEGELTITTVGDVVTATGIVENAMLGVAFDITISGSLTTTGVENTTVIVNSVKTIQNGQLIIRNNGLEYNVQGAVLK